MNTKTLAILMISAFLFSVGATLIYFNGYILVEKKVVPIDFEAVQGNKIGLTVDTDALHFGKIPVGSGGSRYFVVRNQADFDMSVNIGIKADFYSWIYIPPEQQYFVLSPDNESRITVKLSIPKDAEAKQYNGSMIVLFKRV